VIEVNVPSKQLHLGRLKTELVAAGVPVFPGDLKLIYAGQDRLIFRFPAGTDPAVAARVIADHVDPRTPVEMLASQLQGLMGGKSPLLLLIRSALGEIYDSLVETRQELQETRAELRRVTQQLIDASVPIQPTTISVNPQPNREWGQALQAVLQRAVQEVQP
jgi:hypothetical protein